MEKRIFFGEGHSSCILCKHKSFSEHYCWKDVNEDLPKNTEEGIQVIAWFENELFPDGDMSFMTYLDNKFLAVNEEGEIEDYTDEVTHWMFQPSRPTKV